MLGVFGRVYEGCMIPRVPFSTHFWVFGRVYGGCMSPHKLNTNTLGACMKRACMKRGVETSMHGE